MPDPSLLRTFRFQVRLLLSPAAAAGANKSLSRGLPPEGAMLGDGGFQECSGLDVEMEIHDVQEGGRNDAVVRLAGRAKYQNIVLKRGMFYSDGGNVNAELWKWIQNTVAGVRPLRRYNGVIEVMSGTLDDKVVARWAFDRGLPAKLSGPQLNAKTGEVAIEELHIAHEGLRLVEG